MENTEYCTPTETAQITPETNLQKNVSEGAGLLYWALILSPSLQLMHREPSYDLVKDLNEGSMFEWDQFSKSEPTLHAFITMSPQA